MAANPNPAPVIIIKRSRKAHGGHHGGAWKVAYADFVTAMMALFIVLWLLSSSEQVQKAVGGYFTDPEGKGKDVGNGLKGTGSESLALRKDDMNKIKDKLEEAIRESSPLQRIRDHVLLMVTSEGLRVELIEDEKGVFFQSGNDQPSEYGKELLATLAQEIGKLPNRVTIEGHTDSRPFTGRGEYSNWELSADRANAARRWMQSKGLRRDQVSQVRGFADENLRKTEDPKDASNRRVSVIIHYQVKPGATEIDPFGKDARTAGEKVKPGASGESKPGEIGGKNESPEAKPNPMGTKARKQ